MIQNILGKGMDCHLLALKKISEDNGFGTPELFKDESYSISNQFALSTSQVS
jgi:choline O-acetyltransferase